jgi:hypothetical protein
VADESFGCDRCWPAAAEDAAAARDALALEAVLVDESHFIVAIRVCPACAQRYVTVFTETIDWAAGDDPQYWTRMPITETEAAELEGSDVVDEAMLNALAPGRRSLRHDHPKGGPARTSWGTGLVIGPHD